MHNKAGLASEQEWTFILAYDLISDVRLPHCEVDKEENANEGKHSVKDGKESTVYECHAVLDFLTIEKLLPSPPSSRMVGVLLRTGQGVCVCVTVMDRSCGEKWLCLTVL